MKIEGIPDGWELVRIGGPLTGEFILSYEAIPVPFNYESTASKNCVIIRRIPPPLSIPPKVFADGWIVRDCGETLHVTSKPAWDGSRWRFSSGSIISSRVKCAQFADNTPLAGCICRVTWEHGSECEQ